MQDEDLCFRSAVDLAADIRSRRLSPVELARAVTARIDALNPALNCFCTATPDIALEQAKAAEDAVMRRQGARTPPRHPLLDQGSSADQGRSAPCADRRSSSTTSPRRTPRSSGGFSDAGGVFLGKTTTPEFGWKGATDSPLTGITRNPWNLERTPGGSSGGASAQVAAGLGPLAQGGDGGGSIRIPSSFAGIFGIKPTTGVVRLRPDAAQRSPFPPRADDPHRRGRGAHAERDGGPRPGRPLQRALGIPELPGRSRRRNRGAEGLLQPHPRLREAWTPRSRRRRRGRRRASRSSARWWRRAIPASATPPTSSS